MPHCISVVASGKMPLTMMMTKYRRILILFSVVLFLQSCVTVQRAPVISQSKPNIIFILADDQRNDTLGCAGHPVVKTPTIDRLAGQGMRFENAFVTTPICAASRASIFTGLYERHHGFTFGKPPVSVEHAEQSYPALLKQAGYRTAYIGKSHARFEDEEETFKKMFDTFQHVSSKQYIIQDGDGNYRHETEMCGELAIKFIEDTPIDQPFVLSVGFFAAHAVDSDQRLGHHFEPLWETRELYLKGEIPSPKLTSEAEMSQVPSFLKESMNRDRWHWRWDTEEKYDSNIRDYYRLISGIDATVARILSALKERGQEDNTIIVYAADNGYMMGDRQMAGKWNHYEQSLRVPLIIYDPRQDPELAGRLSSEMALNIDIAPTLLDYCGVEIPDTYDGKSLRPLVEAKEAVEWRDAFYCEHLMEREDIPKWTGVRTKTFKYALYSDYQLQGGECLHDLVADPNELVNLATDPAYEKELKKMRELHRLFQEQIPCAETIRKNK